MSNISSANVLTCIPNEELFIGALQNNLIFNLGPKTVKKGKLVLYKKIHYHIQFTLVNGKGNNENFEVPIPFSIENHPGENLIFFDYRISTLSVNDKFMESYLKAFRVKHSEPSQYFDKILEIKIF